MSQQECEILRESIPYVKLYRYNPKHLYPKLNGYGDNGRYIYILGNNLTKLFKVGGPSKLHSAKSLEGTSVCNAGSQKGNRNTKCLAHTSLVRPVL